MVSFMLHAPYSNPSHIFSITEYTLSPSTVYCVPIYPIPATQYTQNTPHPLLQFTSMSKNIPFITTLLSPVRAYQLLHWYASVSIFT